jgi:hypothetical protein
MVMQVYLNIEQAVKAIEKCGNEKEFAALLRTHMLPPEILMDYFYILPTKVLCATQALPLKFLREYKSSLAWDVISENVPMTIEFVEEFENYIYWPSAIRNSQITVGALLANQHKYDVKKLIAARPLQAEFITKLWLTNDTELSHILEHQPNYVEYLFEGGRHPYRNVAIYKAVKKITWLSMGRRISIKQHFGKKMLGDFYETFKEDFYKFIKRS